MWGLSLCGVSLCGVSFSGGTVSVVSGAPLPTAALGRTALRPTRLVFGTAPLATVFWGNDEATAVQAVTAALDAGIGMIDTAPLYGLGEAESRVGAALVDRRAPILTTKVGRTLSGPIGDHASIEFDFARDAVLRSLEGSMQRLGVDRIDVVHVHDPDDHLAEAVDSCVPTLVELREQGVIGAVSVGANSTATVAWMLEHADLDVVMVAGRLSLLDRSAADELLPQCGARGVGVLVAGVFNSGVLARPAEGAWYDYAPADAALVERARRMNEVCARHGISLRAAAMQLPLRHPEVAAVVVGMASAAEVAANVADFVVPIPDEVWSELDTI